MFDVNLIPSEAVKDKMLVYCSEKYESNKKEIHWSGASRSKLEELAGANISDILSRLMINENVMAIWCANDAYVIAWVE